MVILDVKRGSVVYTFIYLFIHFLCLLVIKANIDYSVSALIRQFPNDEYTCDLFGQTYAYAYTWGNKF